MVRIMGHSEGECLCTIDTARCVGLSKKYKAGRSVDDGENIEETVVSKQDGDGFTLVSVMCEWGKWNGGRRWGGVVFQRQ